MRLRFGGKLVSVDTIVTERTISRFRVRAGSEAPPMSKWKYRLLSLRLWWMRSIPQLVLEEIGSLPIRILWIARRRIQRGRRTTRLPVDPRRNAPCYRNPRDSRLEEFCNESMESLRRDFPWATDLDLEAFLECYRRGAVWAFGKSESDIPLTQP